MEVHQMECFGGTHISNAITEAIALAKDKGGHACFEFNGVTITVAADSNPALIERDFSRNMSGCIKAQVGPYPAAVLTDEEKDSDGRVHQENIRRQAEAAEEYRRKQQAMRETADAKLAGDSGIELADPDTWATFKANNTDPYGGACVTYAERWARLMQVEMATGKPLAECADPTSHEADVEGITGFMYGCAVATLAKCWKHGEELRRWHNLKTQIRDEGERANESGGVLNPAMLNIG